MDQRLKNILDDLENRKIGMDDTFMFRCTMCGKCCTHREDILLNPFDIYRMAKELNMQPHEFFNKYCDTYLGGDSRMVIVRILPRGTIRRCPLMRNQKCMVHKVKPSVCALFPVGRALKANVGDTADTMDFEVEYFIQDIHCGDPSEPHTVREWLSDFDYLLDVEFFKKWTKMIRYYGSVIKTILKNENEENIDLVAKCILSVLYLNYRTDEPFHPQLEENDRRLRELFSTINA